MPNEKYVPTEEFLKECGFEFTEGAWVYHGSPFRLWEQQDFAHAIAIDNFLNIQSDTELKLFLKILFPAD